MAELAFLTAEDFRGRGVAGLVLAPRLLAEAAGLSQFEADVLAENQSMLAVFRRSGLPQRSGERETSFTSRWRWATRASQGPLRAWANPIGVLTVGFDPLRINGASQLAI